MRMRDAAPHARPPRQRARAGTQALASLCVCGLRVVGTSPLLARCPPNQDITCAMAAAASSSQSTETQVLVLSRGVQQGDDDV